MPQLHFVKEGRGPVVVLSHALGCDLGMWDGVAALLAGRYTVLRFDHRGHGRSPGAPAPWTMADLAGDAAQLITQQADGPVHFVGQSLGGMVAQQLAALHPDLVMSIVVANSASRFDETGRGIWKARIESALNRGVASLAEGSMQRWFTREFRASAPGALRVAELRRTLEATDPKAYAATCDAIARIDFASSNPLIACPALVVSGLRDEATPPEMSEAIAHTISGAECASLDAAHLSAVEKPEEFARLITDFLQSL